MTASLNPLVALLVYRNVASGRPGDLHVKNKVHARFLQGLAQGVVRTIRSGCLKPRLDVMLFR
jgi:hypothetical protein